MKVSREGWLLLASISLAVMTLAMRLIFLPFSNGDMQYHNLVWYEKLAGGDILHTLGTSFAEYTPPYTYLVALATFTRNIFPPLAAIKLISICFDILSAFIVYSIVKLKYPAGHLPTLAAAIFLSAPTIILNSSYWGQVDAIYTTFLLLCLYCSLRQWPVGAIVCFGLAFTIKAQAVFLFPFLLMVILHRRISPANLLLVPAIYLLAILPTVLLGRPLREALMIYASQSETYQELSKNAPNLYALLPNEWYSTVYPLGMLLTLVVISVWLYNHMRIIPLMDRETMALYALTSVLLVPYLLPKMHERYFYAADAFAIVLIFFRPSLWFIAVIMQTSSFLAYTPYLFKGDAVFVTIAAVLNTIVVGILLRRQTPEVQESHILAHHTSP